MPLVSVLMPVYNAQEYLGSALQSILEQSFKDFEFLIMDDGSVDESSRILKYYSARDLRIKVIKQKNQGITNSLNSLIKLALGEFIARMDADDIAYPERLEKQIQYLQEHPDVGVVGCWTQIMMAENRIHLCQCFPDDNNRISEFLDAGHNPFVHPSVMMRRQVLNLVSPPYRFRNSQDFDLWLRLLGRTNFGMVEELLMVHRKHSEQVSMYYGEKGRKIIKLIRRLHSQRKNGQGDADWQTMERRILESNSSSPVKLGFDAPQVFYQEAISLQLARGNPKEIRNYMFRAMANSSLRGKAFFQFVLTFLPLPLYHYLNKKRFRHVLDGRYYYSVDKLLTSVQIQVRQQYLDYIHAYNQP